MYFTIKTYYIEPKTNQTLKIFKTKRIKKNKSAVINFKNLEVLYPSNQPQSEITLKFFAVRFQKKWPGFEGVQTLGTILVLKQ